MDAATHNKRMQRARDPDKCVLCWQHRRVADARRYTLRAVAVLMTALAHVDAASAETWILPTDTQWKPELATFYRLANDIESAFDRVALEETRDVPKWDGYTIQYRGRFSDDGVRLITVTGICEKSVGSVSERFDLTKETVGIIHGGVCIFSALYDADQHMLRWFEFHSNGG